MKESETENTVDKPAAPDASGSTAAIPSPEELEALKQQAAKAEENWQRLLRATADFDNFKKRAAREKQESIRYANEALMSKMLPLLDNFEMALAATQSTSTDPAVQALQTGVSMVFQQFKSALTESGLEEIEAVGKPFDPNWHEAVSQQESSEVPEGQVLQQLRKGYRLKDRLLRATTVIVAKQPAA